MTTPIGGGLVQRDGIKIKGGSNNQRLIWANSLSNGLYFKEQAGTSASLLDCWVQYCKFTNNCTGTTSDLAGSGKAGLVITRATGVWVSDRIS